MSAETLFVVLCKPPKSPATKTRLAATVGRYAATTLYQQCLVQVLATVASVEGHLRVAVGGPPLELAPLCLSLAPQAELVQQRGDSFAERQSYEIDRALHDGFSTVVLVASDLPSLPRHALAWASAAAQTGTIGLVPAPDGGYSLLSTSQPVPELVSVSMSQTNTCQALAEAAESAGKRVSIADFMVPDLDYVEDLAMCRDQSIVGVQYLREEMYHD